MKNLKNHPSGRRAVVVAGAAGTAVLLAAVPAFAHVSVQPGTAAKGSYSTVSFKVPNEDDSASTTKVEVNLPTDHPIASVATQPVAGWTVKVTKSKLTTPLKTDDGTVNEAVTKITWSGGQIKPGEFQQFPVSLGPLPADADQLVFKTLQTYDNKQVVRWIEEQQTGQAEPEHPAPTLELTAASSDSHSHDASATSPASASPVADHTETAAADSTDSTARILGILGIVIGILGVGFGVLAGRRRTTPSA
ncbi:YcnI family protein [Streptomyces sp. NPDC059373]